MQKQTCNIDGLDCLCCKAEGSLRVTYILYPMDILDTWIEAASRKYRTSIVVITGMDWDDDLTPWPAKGVPKGCPDFKGLAGEFSPRLDKLVKDAEKRLGLSDGNLERTLIGVSLSGLFTLWQWPQCDLFKNIGSLSGSFWYEGFIEWFERQDYSKKLGEAFFLLGEKEPESKVRAFDTVGINTSKIVALLKADGVKTTFEMVPGNHYQQPIERLNRAMAALTNRNQLQYRDLRC